MTEFTDKIAKKRLSKQKKAEIAKRHKEMMALLAELLKKDPKVSIGKVTAESDKQAIKSISEAVKLLLTVNEQTKTLGGQFGGISSLLDKLTKRLEQVPTEFTLSDTRPDRTDEILSALRELGNLNIDFPEFPEAPEVDTKSVVEAVNKVEAVLKDILARPQAVGLGGGGGGESSSGGATLTEQEAQTALLTTIDADTGAIATDLAAIEVLLTTIEGNQLADGHNVTVDNASIAVTGTFWQATQPVSGTVTANLGATDNGVLDSIDEAVSSKQITGIGHGVKTVTSAGTDEALAGSTACKKVTIQAQTDNTGLIAVGATGVDATEATGTGIILRAGDSFEFDIDNLADVFIDATVNGEGVRYAYFT